MESMILYSQTKNLKKSRKNEIIDRFGEVAFHKDRYETLKNKYLKW